MPTLRCARYVLTVVSWVLNGSFGLTMSDDVQSPDFNSVFTTGSCCAKRRNTRRLRLHRRTGKRLASEAPQAEAAAKAGHANLNSPWCGCVWKWGIPAYPYSPKTIKLPFRKNDEAWVFVYHLYPRFRQTYVFVQLWRAVGGSSRRLPARRSSPLRSVITVTKPRALRLISMLSCGRTPAMAAWSVKCFHLAWPCMTHMLQLQISRCTLIDTDVNHGLKDWRHGLSVKVHVAEGNSIDKRRCAWYVCWRGRRFLPVIPGIPIFFELDCVGWASACSDATILVVMSTI